jgi:hypothetical protein
LGVNKCHGGLLVEVGVIELVARKSFSSTNV